MAYSPKNLNQEQLEAVTYDKGPLLIVAGAGTGKTTVITERIKFLIFEKNILPSEILALTFTEKASREMEERVDKEMPYGYTQMWISTFHSFCDRILRNEALNIGLNPTFKLTTEAESILFLKNNLFKFDLDYFRPLGNPSKFLGGMLQHFSRLKDEDISPEEYIKYAKELSEKNSVSKQKKNSDKQWLQENYSEAQEEDINKTIELAHAYKNYEDLKAKEGIMDFSDLISNTLKLFRTRKNILLNYQNQFKYILVDEFQDTNYAQNELAILLAGNKNITVAGDDDQSIYRFRGAAVSNIIQFRKHFPKSKIIVLTKNYRSTQTILDLSYKLIQNNNPDRLEVKENIVKKLTSERNLKGDKIEFYYTDRAENEADLTAKKISELSKNEKFKFKDFAILVRANDHAQPFTRALERQNIPYQFLGPGQLFSQEEIKDLIAYLKVLYNFEDSVSMYRVLSMPIFDLDSKDIAAILNLSKRKNICLFDAMEEVSGLFVKDQTKEKIAKISSIIKNHLKKVSKETAGQILYYFLEESGILKTFLETSFEEKKAQNIAKFFEKLKTYEVDHKDASIFAVVDWIDLLRELGESPLASDTDWTNNNAVNILTIHSSKGLEFPVVFLVNLVAQRFPTRERKEQIPIPQDLIKEILPEGDFHLEEERRLFYVGMTRTRDLLFFTASNFYGEGKRERKISPFVYEALGQGEVEKIIKQTEDVQKTNQLSLLEWSSLNKEESHFSPPTSNLSHPITYLSYSQIQTFEICPLHYKLKYILKVPTPQSCAQSFGTSVHSVLRDFYRMLMTNQKLNEEEVLELLKKNWINDGYQNKTHEDESFKKAKNIVLNYIKKNLYSNPKPPVALELPFNFYVKNLASPTGGIRVGGRIDRIDQKENGTIEILDYKTGTNIPKEKDLEKNMQLTTYALAAMEAKDKYLNKKPEEVILSLYYLEKDLKFTTTRTMDQLEEAKNYILQKAEEISKSDFKCSKSSFCQICEYKMLCQN